jgi:hypothetical protein
MEKLDRLDWAAGASFRSRGLKIGVRTNDAGILASILRLLPFGARLSSDIEVDRLYSLLVGRSVRAGTRHFHLAYSGAVCVGRSLDLDDVLDSLEMNFDAAVAEFSKREIFLHAGVVGWNGAAIVIPGVSRSGKSTLVKAFLRAGAEYYSDEYAVIDAAGHVRPYPRPISTRQQDPAERPIRESAAILGATVGRGPIPVAYVVLARFRPGSSWTPRRLTSGQAVMALMKHSLSVRLRPRAVVLRLCRVAEESVAWNGVRGEADEVAEKTLRHLESHHRS